MKTLCAKQAFLVGHGPTLRLYGQVGWGRAPPSSQVDPLVMASFNVPANVVNVTPQTVAWMECNGIRDRCTLE
ncbi:MAG: hypothetical protein ABW104_13420 [Candidatus Thiodiazotropha sp. 6PLUC2]